MHSRSKLSKWSLAGLLIVSVPLLSHCSGLQTAGAPTQTVALTGEITYRERIALHPGALFWVFVEQHEAAGGATGVTIAAQRIRQPESQVPVPFELVFDIPAGSDPNVYTLHAFITDHVGRVLWLSEGRALDPRTDRNPLRVVVKRPAGELEAQAGNTVAYSCDGMEFHANVHRDFTLLILPDRQLVLPQALSASGARYSNGTVTYWSKGDEATLEVGPERWSGCGEKPPEGPWADARQRGVEFRAVGQEPGWYLEIDQEKEIVFVADYGTREIRMPVPESRPTGDGKGRIYHARTEAHDLEVRILRKPCADVMSGEKFPFTVHVTLDGKAYHGCGRVLGP